MQTAKCPTCGSETADCACPACGQATVNGAAKPPRRDPPPPPEVANWVIEPVPPDVREHFLRTFDEAEYWAEAREALASGGADIDALIAEIERKVDGKA